MARPLNILAPFLLITLLVGCGKDSPKTIAGPGGSPGGGATSATFSGVYVNGAEFGSVTFTIDYTNSILGAAGTQYAVTGYFVPDGQDTIPLDGLYDPRVGGLSASDSGYTCSGAHSVVNGSETIDGVWAGPNGSGWFGTSCATAQHQTAAYAGTYDGGGGGWVVLLATDSALRGRWYPYFGTPLAVYGSLGSGTTTTRNITLTSGAPSVLFNASGSLTVNSREMQGIWRRFNNFDTAGSGTWKAAHLP